MSKWGGVPGDCVDQSRLLTSLTQISSVTISWKHHLQLNLMLPGAQNYSCTKMAVTVTCGHEEAAGGLLTPSQALDSALGLLKCAPAILWAQTQGYSCQVFRLNMEVRIQWPLLVLSPWFVPPPCLPFLCPEMPPPCPPTILSMPPYCLALTFELPVAWSPVACQHRPLYCGSLLHRCHKCAL